MTLRKTVFISWNLHKAANESIFNYLMNDG